MDFGEALNRWAAARVGLDWEDIERVEFCYDPGGPCVEDTCDYPPETEVLVYFRSEESLRVFTVHHLGFAGVLNELLEVASAPAV